MSEDADISPLRTQAIAILILVTLGCGGRGHTAIIVSLIRKAKRKGSTCTALSSVYTDVPTFVLFVVVTVLLIEVIWVTAAGVALNFSLGRGGGIVRTASYARLASRARWILKGSIPQLIIALMGAMVSRGQTTPVP